MIKNFKELKKEAMAIGPLRIAIAAANNHETVLAAVEAKKQGMVEPILIGDKGWIIKELEQLNQSPDKYECHDEQDPAKAAYQAVKIVSSGDANILMKGNVSTSTFLGTALKSSSGLRTKELLSDVEVFEDNRNNKEKLMIVTDGGINIKPGIKEKISIIKKAVSVAHKIGYKIPKVGLLSASEKIHPDVQSTIDAVAIAKIFQMDHISDCIVDGPFALDNVVDLKSALGKGIESPIAGDADILIMPNMEAGNIFGKCLVYFAGKELAHVALGAKAPILIPSRTAHVETKLSSIALAILMSQRNN